MQIKNIKSDKVIIWASLVTLGIVAVAIIVNRERKKKIKNQILTAIDSGAKSGDTEDISSSDAFNTEYWKTASSTTKLLSVATAQDYAKQLYPLLHGALMNAQGNCSKVLEITKKLENKAQTSQVTFYYNQSGANLYNDLMSLSGGEWWDVLNIFGTDCAASLKNQYDKLK